MFSAQFLQVELRPFHEYSLRFVDVLETKMPPIGRKNRDVGILRGRSGAGFELPIEELVECAVAFGLIGEFGRIEPVLLNEWKDAAATARRVHAAAIPFGKSGAFDQAFQREFSEWVA